VPSTAAVRARDFTLTAVAYGLAAYLSLAFRLAGTNISLVWIPTGVVVAAMLLRGPWLWTVVPVAQTVVAVLEGNGPFNVVRVVAAGTAAAVLTWWVLRRLGFRAAVDRLRDAVALVLAAASGGALGAALNGVLRLVERGPYEGTLRRALNWWLGDVTGILLVVPLICTWAATEAVARRPTRRGELTVLAALLAAVVALAPVVAPQGMTALVAALYLGVPLQAWAGVRMGPRGAAQAMAVVAGGVLLASLTTGGIAPGESRISLVLLDGFLIVSAMGTLLIAALVADRTRAEAELAESRQAEAVRRLAGGIAHDFNNLLTVILGHVDLIGEQQAADPAEELRTIRAAATRAAGLTQQLLEYGQRALLKRSTFEPSALVVEVCETLLTQVGASIACTVSADPVRPSVTTDREQLGRVLLHLGLRSAAAMPRGGTIRLHSAPAANGREVAIAISDSAPLEPGLRERPGDPYAGRLPTGSPPLRASGLELAMAYGFAQQAGGRLEVTGGDAGTTVTLVLPAASGEGRPA
jgi:signal transduction histidine kinase